jgi:acyl-coenzyme A thioesterase 9
LVVVVVIDLENNATDIIAICIQLTYLKCGYVATDGDAQSGPIALTANFTFVARDSMTGKSAPVNRFAPETDREKQLFGEKEVQDKLRKRKREELKSGFENGMQKLHAEGLRG